MKIKEKILKNNTLKSIFTLMSGAVLAQIIPVIMSPILTRIYSVNAFGVYAIYNSILIIFVSFANFKYDIAVINCEKEEEAKSLIIGCMIVTTLVAVGFFILGYLYISFFEVNLLSKEILALISISIWGLTNVLTLTVWMNRCGLMKEIAIGQVIYGSIYAITSYGFGILNFENGLVLGFMLGHGIQLLYMFLSILKKTNYRDIKYDINTIKEALIKNKNYPKYNIGAAILNTCSTQLPIIAIAFLYSDIISGEYAMSIRLVNMPMILIGVAIGNVYLKQASQMFNQKDKEELKRITIANLKWLSLIGAVTMGVLIFFGEELFGIFLGEQWRRAGMYSQILAPMFFINFIVSPISHLFNILGAQKKFLKMNLELFLGRFFGIILGYILFKDVGMSLIIMSLVGTIVYLKILIYMIDEVEVKREKVINYIVKYNFIVSSFILMGKWIFEAIL